MGNYKSSNVNVFPSSIRTAYPQGKFTSEENFVNLVRSVTDAPITSNNDGFVVRGTVDNQILTLDVVIHGYYFSLTGVTQTNNLWFGIKVRVGDGRLVNFEDTSETSGSLDDGTGTSAIFKGLVYNTTGPEASTDNDFVNYWLKVTDGSGNIINKVKLKAESIYFEDEAMNVEDKLKDLETNKQDNLTAGNGITLANNVISVTRNSSLDAVLNNNYTDIAVPKVTDGVVAKNTAADIGAANQIVYIQNGEFKGGTKFWFSPSKPTSGDGAIGDIWVKYNN